jgi:hypothetical protein
MATKHIITLHQQPPSNAPQKQQGRGISRAVGTKFATKLAKISVFPPISRQNPQQFSTALSFKIPYTTPNIPDLL